jgi:2-oxoglutarate ferredoxin oxidoreductase subunit gamma
VVLAAQILGKAALLDGKNVLQTQAYGAEARGSLTKSELIISSSKIDFPAVRKSDILVAMSQEAATRLLKELKESGTLIVESASVTNLPATRASVRRFSMTDTAKRIFGDGLYANMVMLGVLSQVAPVATAESIERAIREATPARSVETNIRAFREGLGLEPAR